MSTPALRAVSGSRYLDGLRVHAVDARFALAAVVGTPLAIALLAPAYSPAPFALLVVGLLAFAAGSVLVSRRWAAGIRLVNDGLIALQEDRVDEALALFRAAASRWHFKHAVAVALHNVGVVATRRGDFTDAVALLRAAYEMLRGASLLSHPQTYGDLARANLVFALACDAQLDEGERVMHEPSDPNAYPVAAAMMARARALLALRREQWKGALDVIDGERRLLRNAIVGLDAPLVEVFEALALEHLGYEQRGSLRPRVLDLVDDDDRAYILRVLPDAAPLLADT
jgi:hypothetical protein